MNFSVSVAICFLVGFIAIMAPFNSGARVCVIDLRQNCSSTTNVCGRFGSSNLCMRFKNSCALNKINCGSASSYNTVNLSYCSGISVNQRTTCNGLSSTSTSGILSSLGLTSSSNVQPIVINLKG